MKTLYQLKNIELQERSSLYDLMLKDAGWDVLDVKGQIMPSKACIEVEVTGKPNEQGVGYVDYVLFGANGKPLAVVEAKLREFKGGGIAKAMQPFRELMEAHSAGSSTWSKIKLLDVVR